MIEFPVLENNDIVLRKLEESDYLNYLDYVRDDLISKQFNFNYDDEGAKVRFSELIEKYSSDKKPFIWVISLKDNNEFVGMITVDSMSYVNKKVSLAYGIRKLYRGNNYAYKACFALINYLFNELDINRIELAHLSDNIPSKKTIEKLGAKYEGNARESKFYINEFKDCLIYSILKKEWLNK